MCSASATAVTADVFSLCCPAALAEQAEGDGRRQAGRQAGRRASTAGPDWILTAQ